MHDPLALQYIFDRFTQHSAAAQPVSAMPAKANNPGEVSHAPPPAHQNSQRGIIYFISVCTHSVLLNKVKWHKKRRFRAATAPFQRCK
jgi:hypothetical protein